MNRNGLRSKMSLTRTVRCVCDEFDDVLVMQVPGIKLALGKSLTLTGPTSAKYSSAVMGSCSSLTTRAAKSADTSPIWRTLSSQVKALPPCRSDTS